MYFCKDRFPPIFSHFLDIKYLVLFEADNFQTYVFLIKSLDNWGINDTDE